MPKYDDNLWIFLISYVAIGYYLKSTIILALAVLLNNRSYIIFYVYVLI